MVVCPGGAYKILALDLEGTEVAAWLNSIGVNAVVLKYRVPIAKECPAISRRCRCAASDGSVRKNATDWKIDPHRSAFSDFLPAATSRPV